MMFFSSAAMSMTMVQGLVDGGDKLDQGKHLRGRMYSFERWNIDASWGRTDGRRQTATAMGDTGSGERPRGESQASRGMVSTAARR